jgi:hypothetical protein
MKPIDEVKKYCEDEIKTFKHQIEILTNDKENDNEQLLQNDLVFIIALERVLNKIKSLGE